MRWFILVTVLLATFPVAPRQPAKSPMGGGVPKPNSTEVTNQADTTEAQHKPTQSATPAIQPADAQVGSKNQSHTVTNGNQTDHSNNKADQEGLAIQRELVRFTGLLVAVGFLQVSVMLLQWLMYRQQATILTGQMQTTRDTERAWVIANPVDNAPAIGFVPSPGAGNLELHLVGVDQQNVVSFSFKNAGNTPARLVETAILYCKVDRLANIAREPDYAERTPLNDLPLVPGDSIGFAQFLKPTPILPKAEADAVWRQEAFLYAFGVVVYRDVYDRLHETRFGFVYHLPLGGDPRQKGFRRELMPPAYNRAT